MKNQVLLFALVLAGLLTSCELSPVGTTSNVRPLPVIDSSGDRSSRKSPEIIHSRPTQTANNETVSSANQKKIRKQREQASASSNETEYPDISDSESDSEDDQELESRTERKPQKAAPVAQAIPGKKGFVFNPFTNNPVDVGGIPSGSLVRDPLDSDSTHHFRVP